jgi:Mu transposase, C-terminal domain
MTRCKVLWQELRHPEYGELTVAEMLEHEQPHLMPMVTPFDGYVEAPGRVSSTCLVSAARNHYSVPCELAGKLVSKRYYPERIEFVFEEQWWRATRGCSSVARPATTGGTTCPWWNASPVC